MKRKVSLLILAVLIASVAVTGGVWAILHAQAANSLINKFIAAEMTQPPEIEVVEDPFTPKTSTEKKNVRVKLTKKSSSSTLVRVKAVVSFQDSAGNTVAKNPQLGADADYEVTYPSDFATNWVEKDGYYYYKGKLIELNQETGVLFVTITTHSQQYHLCVDIIAQAVSEGSEKGAWGISYNNGAWE